MTKDEYIEVLIKNIEYACSVANITPNKLGIESGLGKDIVANLKKGSMLSADKLAEIANYLNVSVDYLLGRTDNPNSCNNVSNIDTTISGTQINGTQANFINRDNGSLAEIETIMSKLSGASRHRAIADILDVLEKYA